MRVVPGEDVARDFSVHTALGELQGPEALAPQAL